MNKIIIPDAAIREYNKKYGQYLPKPVSTMPPPIDEDAMYMQAMGLTQSNQGEEDVQEISDRTTCGDWYHQHRARNYRRTI